jgi:hypothetical protein
MKRSCNEHFLTNHSTDNHKPVSRQRPNAAQTKNKPQHQHTQHCRLALPHKARESETVVQCWQQSQSPQAWSLCPSHPKLLSMQHTQTSHTPVPRHAHNSTKQPPQPPAALQIRRCCQRPMLLLLPQPPLPRHCACCQMQRAAGTGQRTRCCPSRTAQLLQLPASTSEAEDGRGTSVRHW